MAYCLQARGQLSGSDARLLVVGISPRGPSVHRAALGLYGSASKRRCAFGRAPRLSVQERTRELAQANQELRSEVAERERAEASLREAQARLRLARASNTGLWDRNLETNSVYLSPEWKRQLGYEDHELPNRYEEWETRLHPEDRERTLNAVQASIEDPASGYEIEFRLRHKAGSYRWILARASLLRDSKGAAYRMLGSHTDITERKQVEEALIESERRFRIFVNSTPAMLWMTDVDGRCVLFNEAWLGFTGRSLDEELAHEWTGKDVYPDDLKACFTTYRLSFEAHTAFEHQYRLRRNDGEYRWLSEVGILRFDAIGRYEGFIGTAIDITERKEAEAQLTQLALYDNLTGLANRRRIEEELERALVAARRHKQKIAVMFIDLDRFKDINDTLGHEAGDRLLKQVAGRLRSEVRESDAVARLGGDEFVVVLIDIARPEDAASVARKILRSLSAPVNLGAGEVVVSASVGISLAPEDGGDVKTLLRHADTALYHAKEGGKNDYCFHTPSLSARAHHRVTVESGLRRALDRCEFLLEYQPVVADGGLISAVEVLLRWRHPTQGIVAPAEFISVAEECGLIIPIGKWVLEATCAQLQAWQNGGYGSPRAALNLSPRQLRQPGFVTMVQDILATTGAARLELEVTESTLMADTPAVLEVLRGLKELGITLAIDDFGTGYASLAYLKRFPIDALKIDQSFVQNITSDPSDRAIVKAIIAIADSLDLRVVAEGVETEEQLALAREYGCHEYQGYLFSPPVGADAFASLMQRLSAQGPALRV